jgi:PAS domain S-box-containing protein
MTGVVMTIEDLLTVLTQIIFLLVAGSTLSNWAMYRTKSRFDITLVFLSLAIAIIAQDLQRLFPARAPVFGLIFLIALLTQPYLLLRVVRYFHPIPHLIQRIALIGLLLVITLFTLIQLASILFLVLAIVYFFVLEGYAAVLLVRGARMFQGVLGRRLRLASIGSGLLALIFFLALALALLRTTANLPSTLQSWASSTFQILAILSGLSYYLGFSPPRWIRQNWQFAELYHFLNDPSKQAERDRRTVFDELATGAMRTVGGSTAMIASWNTTERRLIIKIPGTLTWPGDSLDTETGAIGRAWQEKKARLARAPQDFGPDTNRWASQFGIRTLFLVPILSSLQPWGMLIIALRFEPLFEQDDLDMLTLLAKETATSLDKFALINELQIMNQSLEQRVTERTAQLESEIAERKQAEEQIRYQANLLQNVSDAVIATDPDFHIMHWNHAAETLYGWSAAEVIGRLSRDILQTEYLEDPEKETRERLLERGIWKGEVIHKRRDGTKINILASVSMLKDEAGKVTGVVAVNRDITARKQAEEQSHFQANLIVNVSDAIIAVDMQLNIQSWNPAAEAMYGWRAKEVVGQPARNILETDFLKTTREAVTKQVFEKGNWLGETLQQHRDGTQIPVLSSLSLYKDSSGKPAGIVAVNRDITQSKEAEERFQLVVEAAPNAIILIDNEGRITLVNSQAEKFFGYNRIELVGLNIDGLVPERFRGNHAGYRASFFDKPQARSMGVGRDLYGLRKNGSEFPVEIGLTPIQTQAGRLVMATIVDITERKHVEEKLQRQNQRLKALREIDTAILSSDSVENIVGAALSHIRELIVCERANLALIEWKKNEAVNFDVRDIKKSEISKGARVSLDLIQDILQVLSKNQPIIIDDLTALPDPPPQIKIFIQEGLRSRCILPLFSQGNLIGSFTLSSKNPSYFDEEKINLGREVANQVAIAITQNNLLNALREFNAELEQRVVERTAELSEANTLLQAMLDNIPDQIYFKDLQSRFIRNSRAQAKLMGMDDPSEVIGKSDFDFFPHAQRAFDEEQELMKAAQPIIDQEEFVVWPDGQEMWVSTTKVPLQDQEGQPIGIMGISRDITERKRFEENIQKLNQELDANRKDIQSILDSMATLNAKVGLDGRLLFVNRAATQASGLAVDELMNTNFLEGQWWSFDPEVQRRVKEAFAKACSGSVINYDEKIFVFGQVLTISFSLTPMLGSDGTVEYILAEGRDISQLKDAEEALRNKTTQLEATNKELEAFSYSVSHDLRAPLRAINGFSQALSVKFKDLLGEQGQHYLNRIQYNTSHMGQLIDDLLSLSRISRREMKQDVVNLTNLAREIDKELRALEPERQVTFEVEEQLKAIGDEGLIRIVLQNLLTNAWKFTSTRTQAHICLGTRDEAFFVQDNGVGFDMAFANKLFGAFQRLHSNAEFPGTGIGLATIQRIIHRHDGKIWAVAEPEKGATFYFTIGEKHES